MSTKSTPDHSPLQKTLSTLQSLCIVAGVLLMLAATYGLLLSRSQRLMAVPTVKLEVSTVNRDIESDGPTMTSSNTQPTSHDQQVKEEILNNLRQNAESQR